MYGAPKESYVVDDAGVLNRVTKSDLKRLLSDLESRKNFRINFIAVRKLTVSSVGLKGFLSYNSKADAFEYTDQVLECWYPSIEDGNNKSIVLECWYPSIEGGNNKGIVILVTSQKEGAVTGGLNLSRLLAIPFLMPLYQRTFLTRSKMKQFIVLSSGWLQPLMAFQILVDPQVKTVSEDPISKPRRRLKRNAASLL